MALVVSALSSICSPSINAPLVPLRPHLLPKFRRASYIAAAVVVLPLVPVMPTIFRFSSIFKSFLHSSRVIILAPFFTASSANFAFAVVCTKYAPCSHSFESSVMKLFSTDIFIVLSFLYLFKKLIYTLVAAKHHRRTLKVVHAHVDEVIFYQIS